MISVIIAGGSGTRLWPLSTPAYPKHLLSIGGEGPSLLQSTYTRARSVSSKVYVVSEAGHIDHVKAQLPDLSDECFIVEPARRGTANCITAALAFISKHHDSKELVASIHADHYIRDIAGFGYTFKQAGRLARREHKIVLVGVEPMYPSTGFGYIEKGTLLPDAELAYMVKSFKEKPTFPVAKKYLKSGQYLWNCGYFVATLDTFVHEMEAHAPELYASYKELSQLEGTAYSKAYLGLISEAIDYALIEKVTDLIVVPATFDWMDLGSFADLHKAVESDEDGNHSHGSVLLDEVQNSFIQNHEDKPVAVIGLDNVVVVNTPHGIVVARKDLSQKVGEASKKLQNPDK